MVETFYASITDEFPNYLQGNAVRQLIMRSLGTLAFFCISIPMVTQVYTNSIAGIHYHHSYTEHTCVPLYLVSSST